MMRSPAESDFVGRFHFRHIRRLPSFVGLRLQAFRWIKEGLNDS